MTDQTQETSNTTKRTPQGQRLPQATIADVRALVQALGDLGGPASRKLVFGQAGKAATGGAADAKWAAMGYYGFREKVSGGKHQISDRGRALISGDPAAELDAKQHAVMSTGFRAIVDRFSTRPVNEVAIAGLLHEDAGAPEDRTKALASILVEVATDAELITDGKFQAAPIEQALEAVGEVTVTDNTKRVPSTEAASSRPAPRVTRAPKPPLKPVETIETEGQSGPFDVSVEIKIDAKDHTPEEIGSILREVRQALSATVG
jgi:hypothetical protein